MRQAGEGPEAVAHAPSVTLTLAGAYHPEGQPLVQRRLLVETSLPLAVLFGEAKIVAFVAAEEIAARARAEGIARVTRATQADGRASEFSADLSFSGDEGRQYTLRLSAPLAWRGLRALTEVEGDLTRVPGIPVGPARLRLDWRAIFQGA